MTGKEAAKYLDKVGQLSTEGGKLTIPVTCEDVRAQWGRVDVLVTPTTGKGSVWVSEDRVTWA